MKTFTKIEIAWAVDAIKQTAEYYNTHSKRCTGVEASLAALRSAQLVIISEKLSEALESGNRRIAIEY